MQYNPQIQRIIEFTAEEGLTGSIDSRCPVTLIRIKLNLMGPLIMLYHIELFEYTSIKILFTIYLTFGIERAKFLGFQNRGFLRGNCTTHV